MIDPWPSSKIERAEQNLAEFQTACATFVKEKPYRVIKHRKNKERRSIELGQPPPFLGLLFGDFVHNLRSALDHTVFELTRDNAPNLSSEALRAFLRRSAFPTCTDPADWEADPVSLNGGLDKVGGVIPAGVAAIRGLQPFNALYDPKMHPLALIAQLDNRDKHRRLNVTVTSVLLVHRETKPGQYRIAPARPTQKEGAHVTLSVPEVEVNPKATLAISLTERGPAPGAILWTPSLRPKLLRDLIVGPDPLFPEWLLACVTGSISLLRSFLRG